jgi:hypothetical protein
MRIAVGKILVPVAPVRVLEFNHGKWLPIYDSLHRLLDILVPYDASHRLTDWKLASNKKLRHPAMAKSLVDIAPLQAVDCSPIKLRQLCRIAKEIWWNSRISRCGREDGVSPLNKIDGKFKIEDVELIDVLRLYDAEQHWAESTEVKWHIVMDTASGPARDGHCRAPLLDPHRRD